MKVLIPILIGLLVMGCGTTKVDPDAPANISDPIVEKAVRKKLNKPTGELTNADLANVTGLYLYGTKITYAGLKEVAKLKQLRTLQVQNTKATKAGVAELQKALPKCENFLHSFKKD